MHHAETFARAAGSPVLVLKTHRTNAPARALYGSRGWSVDDDYITYNYKQTHDA